MDMPPTSPTPAPSSTNPSVRRRARPAIFSRHFFRQSSRRRHSTLETFPSSDRDPSSIPSEDSTSFFSTSFLHRHRHRHRDHPRSQSPHLKPIYIYPGLLRIVRDKAIALDNQCPAVLYKCRECRREAKALSNPNSSAFPSDDQRSDPTDKDLDQSVEEEPLAPPLEISCPHQASCAICLEEFHGKDLVRKLPCNVNHVFHSKCILDWFISHYRCPLCNEPVTNPSVQPNVVTPRLDEPGPVPSQLTRGVLVLQNDHGSNHAHIRLHRPRSVSYSQPSSAQFAVRDQSRVHPPLEENLPQEEGEVAQKVPQGGEKGRRKPRGPRTYSYIVHDNVRMEMNPVIPV